MLRKLNLDFQLNSIKCLCKVVQKSVCVKEFVYEFDIIVILVAII